MAHRSKKNSHKTKLSLVLATLILIAGGLLLWNHHTSQAAKKAAYKVVVRGTVQATTSQPKASTPASEKTPTTSSGVPQGSATDNSGAASTATNSQQWSTSASGAITVKQPGPNSTLKSGGTISGSAKVSEVEYRLIDNTVGVLAQGPISVVNGNFSASLKFTSHSSSGRLDVFSYDPANPGAEINELEIQVSF